MLTREKWVADCPATHFVNERARPIAPARNEFQGSPAIYYELCLKLDEMGAALLEISSYV